MPFSPYNMAGVFARASSGAGSNRQPTGASGSQLLWTVWPVFLVSCIIFTVFLLFRNRYKRVYQPRSFAGSLRDWQRTPGQSSGLFGWTKQFRELDDDFILGHASIDNFLWIRFFKMLAVMSLVGCIITWPVLFPINATGHAPGQNGLDILSFSHITPGPRFYGQAFTAWFFMAFVMYMIWRESVYFIRLQQRYFLSPYQKSRMSTRTVLFVNVPQEARNEEYLRREYTGVRRVWLSSVPEALADKAEERDKAANKLEGAENKMVQNHVKRQIKQEKKGQTSPAANNADGSPAAVVVDPKDVPTHRLPVLKFLPFGKKVNTIDWSRSELNRLIPEVAQEQHDKRNDTSSAQGACFVEFDSVHSAHACLIKAGLKSKTKMTPKEVGPAPDTIIWKNIVKPWPKVKLFDILSTAFVWFLCIFWTIPVAVIGLISNVTYLTKIVPFLSFINSVPQTYRGVITGLLPVILLAVLMALVPIVMNILAKLFEPTQGSAQLKVQGWYFPFQVIQVFLITTFASGASSVVPGIIKNPPEAATLLASNLPTASNFFISYFVLFGLNTAAMQFLNVVPLLFALILGKILDKTPRKMFNRYTSLGGLGWGAIYPVYTNFGVIALSYSSIAPLILGFATVGFTLIYLGFRYNALFTLGTTVSTNGQSYARAMQQLTVGVYLSEICLIGLLACGSASNIQSVGPLVIVVVLLAATIVFHVFMNRNLNKVRADLPEGADQTVAANMVYDNNAEAEKLAGTNGTMSSHAAADPTHPEGPMEAKQATLASTPEKQGFVARIKGYFNPQAAAERSVAKIAPLLATPSRPYSRKEEEEAYIHPAMTSECPVVWIARDKYGVSQQEIVATRAKVGEGLDITDDSAWFNDKGNIEWDLDAPEKAPVYYDRPTY